MTIILILKSLGLVAAVILESVAPTLSLDAIEGGHGPVCINNVPCGGTINSVTATSASYVTTSASAITATASNPQDPSAPYWVNLCAVDNAGNAESRKRDAISCIEGVPRWTLVYPTNPNGNISG